MSGVPLVPEGASVHGEELTVGNAWTAVRQAHWPFWRDAFARFRYGDGFSHSRALALQFSLAFVPLVIAAVGLSGTLATRGLGEVLRNTLIGLTPGGSDRVVRDVVTEGGGSQLALWLGLVFAVVNLTTAMGQVERGANRIYGIAQDRPSPRKYGRALAMAFAAGLPAMCGFGAVLAAPAVARAVEDVYAVDAGLVIGLTYPMGAVLLLVSITALLRFSPRRRQPGWSWLALGALTAFLLWVAFTGVLSLYVALSGSFDAVYGPLTGIIALLLWAQLTAIAVLFGLAVTAELEDRWIDQRRSRTPRP